MKTITVAGGCFWGVQAFFDRLDGVLETEVGYVNGTTESTDYGRIGRTGHAEAVRINYDPQRISLERLMHALFVIIDPTSVDRQGNDRGHQYRTGIYYSDERDRAFLEMFLEQQRVLHPRPIAVELEALRHFIRAEGYHQKYLDKNPGGYCHIDLSRVREV